MPFNSTNLLFAVLSAAYIAAIFLFADSPAVSTVADYNPFSLLHIPLYAVLTLLIILSLLPLSRFRLLRDRVPAGSDGPGTPPYFHIIARSRLLIAGWVSVAVAGVDEYYQSFIPTRKASLTDVLLDAVGIALVVLLALRCIKWHKLT